MRLKKCVLSFLWKLVRDEISLMSFQARGLAMEKAFMWAIVVVVNANDYKSDLRSVEPDWIETGRCVVDATTSRS